MCVDMYVFACLRAYGSASCVGTTPTIPRHPPPPHAPKAKTLKLLHKQRNPRSPRTLNPATLNKPCPKTSAGKTQPHDIASDSPAHIHATCIKSPALSRGLLFRGLLAAGPGAASADGRLGHGLQAAGVLNCRSKRRPELRIIPTLLQRSLLCFQASGTLQMPLPSALPWEHASASLQGYAALCPLLSGAIVLCFRVASRRGQAVSNNLFRLCTLGVRGFWLPYRVQLQQAALGSSALPVTRRS